MYVTTNYVHYYLFIFSIYVANLVLRVWSTMRTSIADFPMSPLHSLGLRMFMC